MNGKKIMVVALCAVLLIVVIVAMVGNSDKNKLVGEWYWDDVLRFAFYSDGTCKVRGEYGTCKWDIVDGKLKITNVYSQMVVWDYSIDGKILTINGNMFFKK